MRSILAESSDAVGILEADPFHYCRVLWAGFHAVLTTIVRLSFLAVKIKWLGIWLFVFSILFKYCCMRCCMINL